MGTRAGGGLARLSFTVFTLPLQAGPASKIQGPNLEAIKSPGNQQVQEQAVSISTTTYPNEYTLHPPCRSRTTIPSAVYLVFSITSPLEVQRGTPKIVGVAGGDAHRRARVSILCFCAARGASSASSSRSRPSTSASVSGSACIRTSNLNSNSKMHGIELH